MKCRIFNLEVNRSLSNISSLEAESINITCKNGGLELFSGKSFEGSVHVDEIKCKTGDFECVFADKVIGEEISFGKGCIIDYAEGKNIVVKDGAVLNNRKIIN